MNFALRCINSAVFIDISENEILIAVYFINGPLDGTVTMSNTYKLFASDVSLRGTKEISVTFRCV